jgi:hypothetical protein
MERDSVHIQSVLIMLLKSILSVSLLCPSVLAAPGVAPFSTFSKVTIFTPPATYTDPRVLYARTVELADGVLLATWVRISNS